MGKDNTSHMDKVLQGLRENLPDEPEDFKKVAAEASRPSRPRNAASGKPQNQKKFYRPLIKYAMLYPDAPRPTFNFRDNGGVDLIAAEDATFTLAETGVYYATVPTTFVMEFPKGVHGLVAGRSGNGFKRLTYPFMGVIDNVYRGNTAVLLWTHSADVARGGIKQGQAIAQLVLLNYAGINLSRARYKQVSVEELTQTERGERGFGETTGNMV